MKTINLFNNNSEILQLIDKIMSIALPVMIGILVVGAIVAVIQAAGEGMFSADGNMRKESKKRFIFIFICLAIGLLASSLVLAFKASIIGIV